jgi:hypothetical protein
MRQRCTPELIGHYGVIARPMSVAIQYRNFP